MVFLWPQINTEAAVFYDSALAPSALFPSPLSTNPLPRRSPRSGLAHAQTANPTPVLPKARCSPWARPKKKKNTPENPTCLTCPNMTESAASGAIQGQILGRCFWMQLGPLNTRVPQEMEPCPSKPQFLTSPLSVSRRRPNSLTPEYK